MKKIVAQLGLLLILFDSTGLFAQTFTGQALGGRNISGLKGRQAGASPTFGSNGTNPLDSFNAGQLGQETPLFNPSQIPLGGGTETFGYQVHVLGQVQLPGTYRLPPSTRLAEAVRIAGSVTNTGSKRNIELRRKQNISTYDLVKFENDGSLADNPFLSDNDVIFVPFSEKSVQIQGPVKHPGIFEMTNKGSYLSDLIALSGGFTAGVSLREPLKVIRYTDGEKKLLDVTNVANDTAQFELQNGDIVVVPHILGQGRQYDYDIAALPADNVFYPSFNDNVYVLGAVSVPGSFTFNSHFSVQDFMNLAGPMQTANKHSVYVLKPDGTRVRRVLNKKDYLVSPGDTIIVPERAFRSTNVIGWYSTITSSIISGYTIYQLTK